MTLYSISEAFGGGLCFFLVYQIVAIIIPQLTHLQNPGYRELRHNRIVGTFIFFDMPKAALIVTFKQDTVLGVA